MTKPARQYAISVHNRCIFQVHDASDGTVLHTQSLPGKISTTSVNGNIGSVSFYSNGQRWLYVYDLDRNMMIRRSLASGSNGRYASLNANTADEHPVQVSPPVTPKALGNFLFW